MAMVCGRLRRGQQSFAKCRKNDRTRQPLPECAKLCAGFSIAQTFSFAPRRVSEKVFLAYGFPLRFGLCDVLRSEPLFWPKSQKCLFGRRKSKTAQRQIPALLCWAYPRRLQVSVPPKLARNGRETAEISPSQNRRFEILAKFGSKSKKSQSPNHKGRKP